MIVREYDARFSASTPSLQLVEDIRLRGAPQLVTTAQLIRQ